ncbi:MAG: hypothetical protein E6H10_12150 [Bacteroidetes bacterium]|nr:MAG: hypothetical protein E6H10_12150 [Bacteroidota bacterium]
MSLFYETAGEYQTALSVIQQARPYVNEGPLFKDVWSATIGDIYRLLGKYDSASYYLNPFNTDADPSLLGRKNLSRLYIDLGDYDKALSLINSLIEIKNYPADPDSRGVLFTISASACFGKKDYTSALKFAREGLPMLKAGHRKVRMIDNYELLAKIFHCLRKDDSAYYYQTRFYEMKDSIVNRQFLWRLNNYKNEADEEKKTSQINLLNKENQLKDQKLKQQALVRNSLVGGFILLFLLALVIFRNLSLKRKKERAELQKKGSELEMQALRAQMNPHFIFNCLSSINKFILKEDTDTASDYLTRFSRLIRTVLTNSQLSLIPLSDEIEMVRLYLEMERLRFSDSFDYNIIYENTIESETIYIPPMLLQPFCENAIWHGLMHKQGQGKLDVTMSVVNDQLQCVIADNGIGREKAAEMKTKSGVKQKSFGLKITTERLALFNNEKSADSFFRTEDVLDQDGNISGTKVILNIKLKQQATTQTVNEPA